MNFQHAPFSQLTEESKGQTILNCQWRRGYKNAVNWVIIFFRLCSIIVYVIDNHIDNVQDLVYI